ncbi:L-xylulose reductase [Fragariocoptes setiger]|uniref:L-xylulose reductase n=1 Tax=Fragariocoptes setiger TaxID=1670756 RepID=A0ABQ7SAL8_9ACAR|nr:L-xylulose reductase [Fragariocoptes setiger]
MIATRQMCLLGTMVACVATMSVAMPAASGYGNNEASVSAAGYGGEMHQQMEQPAQYQQQQQQQYQAPQQQASGYGQQEQHEQASYGQQQQQQYAAPQQSSGYGQQQQPQQQQYQAQQQEQYYYATSGDNQQQQSYGGHQGAAAEQQSNYAEQAPASYEPQASSSYGQQQQQSYAQPQQQSYGQQEQHSGYGQQQQQQESYGANAQAAGYGAASSGAESQGYAGQPSAGGYGAAQVGYPADAPAAAGGQYEQAPQAEHPMSGYGAQEQAQSGYGAPQEAGQSEYGGAASHEQSQGGYQQQEASPYGANEQSSSQYGGASNGGGYEAAGPAEMSGYGAPQEASHAMDAGNQYGGEMAPAGGYEAPMAGGHEMASGYGGAQQGGQAYGGAEEAGAADYSGPAGQADSVYPPTHGAAGGYGQQQAGYNAGANAGGYGGESAGSMHGASEAQSSSAYGASSDDYSKPELLGKITSSLAEALHDDENPFAGKGVETTHTTSYSSRGDSGSSGKTVLVTGAGQGIGNALVFKLVECKAKVIAVSRTQSRLDKLKASLPHVDIICCDLSDWDETKEKLAKVCENVDFLVNNAAYLKDMSLGDIDEHSIDQHFNLNIKAAINLIQLVGEGMRKRRSGSIVNVSSISAISAIDQQTVYASTKAAIDMVTKLGAKEWGKHNIRVNSVNPTVVWTEMGKAAWTNDQKRNEMLSKTPMGRFAEVHEVVFPIVFLLSDYASMINGVMLPVDGGFLAC